MTTTLSENARTTMKHISSDIGNSDMLRPITNKNHIRETNSFAVAIHQTSINIRRDFH